MLRRLSVTLTTTILWLSFSSLTLAETKKPQVPDKFPPSPLEITTPDPLVRSDVKKQPLTLREMQTLQLELEKLNQEAIAKLQAGDQQGAFDTWNRELRLQRYLGSLSEVQALGRVGGIAYQRNEREQVQYITQRLQAIQKRAQAQKTPNLQLLRALGQAYQQVRSPQAALGVYEQVLTLVRQQRDPVQELETLTTIGNLHLSWFDYPKAAATYQELIKLATTRGDNASEITYLQELAYIYEQGRQPQQAIKIRNQLVQIHQDQNNLIQLPALKLAIASDYETLAQNNPIFLEAAFKNYQEAYITAWELQQYVRASEALQKLIALYRSQGQIDEALQASQILIQAQELAADFYGLMKAYDLIGQIYLERKDYTQARIAFQQGLQVAQQLNYEQGYFTQQIQKVSGQNTK